MGQVVVEDVLREQLKHTADVARVQPLKEAVASEQKASMMFVWCRSEWPPHPLVPPHYLATRPPEDDLKAPLRLGCGCSALRAP